MALDQYRAAELPGLSPCEVFLPNVQPEPRNLQFWPLLLAQSLMRKVHLRLEEAHPNLPVGFLLHLSTQS